MPGLKPNRLKIYSIFLTKLVNLKKHKDLMDMLKQFMTTSITLNMVLISTTLSLSQEFMLSKLRSTTLSIKLHSKQMLSNITEISLALNKLEILHKALMISITLVMAKCYTYRWRKLRTLLNNTFRFLTFLQLGNTKSSEELSSI